MLCLVIKMVLDLLKWLKETSFHGKKKNYKTINFCTEGKLILQIKKEFMNFSGKGKVAIKDFWK